MQHIKPFSYSPGNPHVIIDNVSISYDSSFTVYDTVCNYSKNGYRYGFNGMEKVNEIAGDGNDYDFGDGRLGRFFSIDMMFKNSPESSVYTFACNTPIFAIDFNGLSPKPVISGTGGYELVGKPVIKKVKVKLYDDDLIGDADYLGSATVQYVFQKVKFDDGNTYWICTVVTVNCGGVTGLTITPIVSINIEMQDGKPVSHVQVNIVFSGGTEDIKTNANVNVNVKSSPKGGNGGGGGGVSLGYSSTIHAGASTGFVFIDSYFSNEEFTNEFGVKHTKLEGTTEVDYELTTLEGIPDIDGLLDDKPEVRLNLENFDEIENEINGTHEIEHVVPKSDKTTNKKNR